MSFRTLFICQPEGRLFRSHCPLRELSNTYTNTWTIGVSVLTKRIRLCIGHVCSLLDLSLKRCHSGVIVVLWWKNVEKWRNRLIAHLTEKRKKEVWLVVPASLERGPYGRALSYNHFELKNRDFLLHWVLGISASLEPRCIFGGGAFFRPTGSANSPHWRRRFFE